MPKTDTKVEQPKEKKSWVVAVKMPEAVREVLDLNKQLELPPGFPRTQRIQLTRIHTDLVYHQRRQKRHLELADKHGEKAKGRKQDVVDRLENIDSVEQTFSIKDAIKNAQRGSEPTEPTPAAA